MGSRIPSQRNLLPKWSADQCFHTISKSYENIGLQTTLGADSVTTVRVKLDPIWSHYAASICKKYGFRHLDSSQWFKALLTSRGEVGKVWKWMETRSHMHGSGIQQILWFPFLVRRNTCNLPFPWIRTRSARRGHKSAKTTSDDVVGLRGRVRDFDDG